LDRAIAAIEVAAEQRERELERLRIRSQFQPHSQEQQYAQKWTELKEKLSNSRWFQVVNDILLQNPLMQSVKSRYVKPAEAFFNTATEVYMTHGGSFEQFVEEMKLKMGDAWDERLANHAYGQFANERVETLTIWFLLLLLLLLLKSGFSFPLYLPSVQSHGGCRVVLWWRFAAGEEPAQHRR